MSNPTSQTPSNLQRTSLFECHQKAGARLVPFAGWEMPVQYTGVADEHLATRQAAGLFDVSHMGEFRVEGRDAARFLNYLLTNNVEKMAVGQAQYSVMCHPSGGIVDDLVSYRRGPEHFMVVVNAANVAKDYAHFESVLNEFKVQNKGAVVQLANDSHLYTQIALQGPSAAGILAPLVDRPLEPIKNYWFVEGHFGNIPTIIARTGYTGEDGFELYVPWGDGPTVWNKLLDAGRAAGIKPVGLGARDTLRLEMKYPLYGQELTDHTHPLEAGCSWVVKFDKGDFVGRQALIHARENGMTRKLVGLRLKEPGIARTGYPLLKFGRRLGEVTSGTQSPMDKTSIAIGYVETQEAAVGSTLAVEIRGREVAAEICETPFYRRKS